MPGLGGLQQKTDLTLIFKKLNRFAFSENGASDGSRNQNINTYISDTYRISVITFTPFFTPLFTPLSMTLIPTK